MSSIIICGTTGVGKSRLAVELARALSRKAKIINADAMQVYDGLDVITNKVPLKERGGVDHLLLGFKQPGEQYVVGDWVRDASAIIADMHQKQELPIVVGGTSYWIQHLLFANSLPNLPTPTEPASPDLARSVEGLPNNLRVLFSSLPAIPPSAASDPDAAFELHALLGLLDPTMASRWHWRDTRKVLRSLQIITEHGRPASEVVVALSNPVLSSRYRALVFWLYADPEVLNLRLDHRVDMMIEAGLLDEIRSLNQQLNIDPSEHEELDHTLGIFQSIA